VHFCLIRVPGGSGGPSAEAAVVVPGAERTAMLVPLIALPDFLPLLGEAMAGLEEQRCSVCAEPLPGGPPREMDDA
jgi:hypothetical protein